MSFDDVEVVWADEPNKHWTHAFSGESIERLSLKGFRGGPAKAGGSAVELKGVSELSVEGCKAEAGTGAFLSLEQVEPEQMFIVGNDFSKAEQAIRFKDGSEPDYFASGNRMPK
jgi:hypothetical protein